MNQFSRGREIQRQIRQTRSLVQDASAEPQSAISVVAVSKVDGSQSLVGFALTARGVGELLAVVKRDYPEHTFHEVATRALLR